MFLGEINRNKQQQTTMVIIGSLARAGKNKYQTPYVAKSEDSKAQLQGHKKFRVKSSSNVAFKSGAHRLESRNPSSNNYLSNTFHKFNTERGINRMEYSQVLKQVLVEKRMGWYDYPRSSNNHKKWHRNHPADGFYTKREQFLD